MRNVGGLLAFHLLVLGPGVTFLLATGLVALRPRDLLASVGLAHLVGVAATTLVGIVLLVAGGSLTLPVFTVISLVLAGAFLAVALLRHRRWKPYAEEPLEASPGRNPLAVGLAVAIAIFVTVQVVDSLDVPTAWDAAHNWTLKGATLLVDGDLSSGVFRDDDLFAGSHPGYPILHPVLQSVVFRFVGKSDQGIFVAELWLLLAAFVGAVVYLLRPRGLALALVLAPLGIVVASPAAGGVLRGDADVTMAVFLATGIVSLGVWIERASGGARVPSSYLAVAALMLAAAANVKNEGIAFAVVALAVVAAVALWRRRERRELLGLAGAAGAVLAAMVPWRLWVAAEGPFRSDVASASDVVNPGYLADHIHQLDIGARWVITRALEGTGAGWLIPAFLVLALLVAAVAGDRGRTIPAFYLAATLGLVAALLVVYWTSPQPDVAAHIERTSLRTITGPLLLAAAALAHLLARLSWPPSELVAAGRERKSNSAAST